MATDINLDHRIRQWLIPDDWSERVQTWLSLLLQFALASILIAAAFEQQYNIVFMASLVLTLTFLPALVERQLGVHLPIEFTLVNCLILYASFALGEISDFYERFWWWDLMLHSFSALVMGLIGFLFVYVFYRTRRIQIPPIYVAITSFGFAITVGTLWEIFEFSMDWSFGINMQKSGLVDTMTDLMVDATGGFVAALIGYHYVKDGDSLLADRLVKHFINKNPKLFKSSTQT
jgi:hypothetical protein